MADRATMGDAMRGTVRDGASDNPGTTCGADNRASAAGDNTAGKDAAGRPGKTDDLLERAARELTFAEKRALYQDARRAERVRIAERLGGLLAYDGLIASARGGCGKADYIGAGSLEREHPYDLTNWLWINIKQNGKDVLTVSLQAPDQDRKSKNHHCLVDRIALIGPDGDGFDGSGAPEVTRFTLPLDDREIEELAATIRTSVARRG